MDPVLILSFVLMATLLVISPGPNGVLIAKTVPTSGRSAGFANIVGFILAFYIHGALSVFGLSVLLLQSAQLFFIFKLLGAGYLCWIGVKSLLSAWKQQPAPVTSRHSRKPVVLHSAFFEGFLTNLFNPKVSMFYLAAFPQFIPAGNEMSTAFMLVFLHSIINLIWFGSMILVLGRIKNLRFNSSISRWLKATTGVVFIGFGAKLATLKA